MLSKASWVAFFKHLIFANIRRYSKLDKSYPDSEASRRLLNITLGRNASSNNCIFFVNIEIDSIPQVALDRIIVVLL
jgi:hypothetical protein